MQLDLTSIPIIDHHAHSLLRSPPASPQEWQGFFTESREPELVQKHGQNLLIYRYATKALASLLGCDPIPEAVLAARDSMGLLAWSNLLIRDANIVGMLIDYGFRSILNYGPEDLKVLLPCRLDPILRLETLAQDLILKMDTIEQVVEAFRAEVEAAPGQGYVAMKSIIAYRTGLAIHEWPNSELLAAFSLVKEKANKEGMIYLASPPINDMLVLHALDIAEKLRMPVQFHSGFGDADQDMLLSNPLHFRPLLQSGKYYHVPWVILHMGYPYVRQAGYLASIYTNVFVDLSLVIPFAISDVLALLTELMGLAPLSKLLYASDGFSLPELFWLGAKIGREKLELALGKLVEDKILNTAEAIEAAEMILYRNTETVYELKRH